jgi:phosphonopyruvate decarboxylase
MVSAATGSDGLAERFFAVLEAEGFDFFSGVPCSLLSRLWRKLEALPADRYVPAVREDSAIGLAAGAYLGGRNPCVLMQNSGLGTSMNALASLNAIYDLPVLLVVSWRGEGGRSGVGHVDAPEHWLTGETTLACLELLGIPGWQVDPADVAAQVRMAKNRLATTRHPVALIVKRGLLEGET